jgi:23S rRNA (cytosine1962-C5)-methyltransferase
MATRGRRGKRSGPVAGDGVVVNGYSERWLRQGFPWVYQEEVVARTGALVPGHVVRIRARDGAVLGTGVWDTGKVEVRRFRRDDGPIDSALMEERVVAARARRRLPPDTTAWRWVNGENDQLPGIRVDVWGPAVSISLDSPSLSRLVDPLLGVLQQESPVEMAWVHPRKTDPDVTVDWSKVPMGQVVGARPSGDVIVTERGVRVGVRPWDGSDAGLYCDMRGLRTWLEPHWAGRRVLNTFAYTGMFSVCAAKAGASAVTTTDLSAPVLDRAQDNFRLNDLDPGAHTFLAEDTFRALDILRRAGEQFDVIIADPPSFSHSGVGTWSTAKDLGKLVAGCLRVLAPGGWLVIASNLGTMSPKEFRKHILTGSQKVKRPLRIVHEACPPIDFPAAMDFPESRYLKCWVLEG